MFWKYNDIIIPNFDVILIFFQSNEAGSSTAMELLGLKRSLTFMDDNNVQIDSFTTDRHPSIKKYMRDNRPGIKHWFDVWHVAKGVLCQLRHFFNKGFFFFSRFVSG